MVKHTENHVPWLNHLLSIYPGSRHGNSETRGLDSQFAVDTYVETPLDTTLLADIKAGRVNLVILSGNAGDGKTAFLQYLVRKLGVQEVQSSSRVLKCPLPDGRMLQVNLDGSAAWQGRSANELLNTLFEPFQAQDYSHHNVHIVAINSGKLLEWIESHHQETYLTQQLRQALLGEPVALDSGFRLIDFNQRSLVGGVNSASKQVTTDFLNTLIDRLLGVHANHWQPCHSCGAQSRCTAWHSVQTLRGIESGPRLRVRLTDALQACHQRGEVHITARELRATLSYILFGVHHCNELHENPELCPPHYDQRVFDADSPQRQGQLLAELVQFDPALEAHPKFDRQLLKNAQGHSPNRLAEARRRAYFEHPNSDIKLANGRYLDRFRSVPQSSDEEQTVLCRELCLGISRLEDLPPIAFTAKYLEYGTPLRMTPRTPIESAFWVAKPWTQFSLETPLANSAQGLETLHAHLNLIYRYGNGSIETLLINLELFHRLLELKEGVQISGISQDSVFANLKVFTQRLAHEDTRELYSWHPAEDCRVFRLRVALQNSRLTLLREPLPTLTVEHSK